MKNHSFKHIPVLLNETIQSLNIKKNGIYFDCTFGCGGHSLEILKHLGSLGRLYAIDRDPEAINIAKRQITDHRFKIIHGLFSNIWKYSKINKIEGKLNGILLDLGVSSIQIDNPKRGFSFIQNGPLDMRMNPDIGLSAFEWLKNSNVENITKILSKYGEEKFSKKIAHAIFHINKTKPITTTIELVNIIQKIIPKKYQKKHPARKSFQAIRIHINQELQELKIVLKHVLKLLAPKGRLLVICFHSLENKIVKNFIIKHGMLPLIPEGLAVTETEIKKFNKNRLKIIKKIHPNKNELTTNNRSRSAILRIAEMREYDEK